MIEKAKQITLKARKDVFSGNIGDYITSFNGDGLDFKEIKEYSYGDDVKKINWKATAKSGDIKVNVFNESRQLNVIVAFMLSGSLHFGSIKLKSEVCSELIALLGFSSTLHHNLLHPIFFSEKSHNYYEPTLDENSIYKLVEDSLSIKLLEKDVDYQAFCEYINSVVKKQSIIFMIGDFYGDVDLSYIAHKNQVYALIVRDRLEENPKLYGEFDLVNPINLKNSEFNISKSVAKKYSKLIKEQDSKLYEHFLKHQITYGKIYTDDDIYLKLSYILRA